MSIQTGGQTQPPASESSPSASIPGTQAAMGHSVVLDHQKVAFEKLLAVGRACFSIQRSTLPIKPRTNTMIIGPSGSGKSHLARSVAEELGAAFIAVSVAEWMLLGSSGRGGCKTWPMLFDFLVRNQKSEGVVIFIDEIDKLYGMSTWDSWVRQECFKLLDLQIPVGLTDSEYERPDAELMNDASEVLVSKTLILAAGAFQFLWETSSRPTLGFGGPATLEEDTGVDLTDLADILPRELVNRFRSDVIVLPQLAESDYRRMLHMVGERLPAYLRQTYLKLGEERLPDALRCRQGCRFVEELLLDVLIAEREAVRTNTSPCVQPVRAPAPIAPEPIE